MDRPLHLAAIGGAAAARRRIVGAAQLDDLAGGVLHDLFALHDVAPAQADFAAGGEAEELLRRILEEVVALDPELAPEEDRTGPRRRVLGVVDRLELLELALRPVDERDLERIEDRHAAQRRAVELLAHAVLEESVLDHRLLLGDADALAEIADRRRRVAAPADAGERRHARVVPARDDAVLHETQQLALREHGVGDVQARELDLARRVDAERGDEPVVERAVVLELERADRVRDALDRVRLAVRPVVHRVDAPAVAGAVVTGMQDAVHHRVAQVDVARRHVDLRPQHARCRRGTRRRACGAAGRGSPRARGSGRGSRVPARSRGRGTRGSPRSRGRRRRPCRPRRAARPRRRAGRSSRRRRTRGLPSRSRASARRAGSRATYSSSSVVGLVSSKRRLQRPPYSAARPKLRQIDLAWPRWR